MDPRILANAREASFWTTWRLQLTLPSVLARGEEFSLREFHDRFLMMGLPIPLAREAMMPDADQLSQSGSGSTPRPSANRS